MEITFEVTEEHVAAWGMGFMPDREMIEKWIRRWVSCNGVNYWTEEEFIRMQCNMEASRRRGEPYHPDNETWIEHKCYGILVKNDMKPSSVQRYVFGKSGEKYRVDFAFIQRPGMPPSLIIECDGWDTHQDPEKDRERDLDHGIPTIRLWGHEIEYDEEYVIRTVRDALRKYCPVFCTEKELNTLKNLH